MYIPRLIDSALLNWKNSSSHKPLLVRGARQVGKSSSVRNLGSKFKYFVELNFEKHPEQKSLFQNNSNIMSLVENMSTYFQVPIIPGDTLLFIDEIQACEEALKALWSFKEDYPSLHVIAAGSLLEFTLKEIHGYGVGRISSLFMYPLSFDEYLMAQGKEKWLEAKKNATFESPLIDLVHNELQKEFRTFLIVGGMPAAVSKWIETKDFTQCAVELEDIQQSYYDDFAKYKKNVDPALLRMTLFSVIAQIGKKFVYAKANDSVKIYETKKALTMLTDAGLIKKVCYTSANGIPLGAEVNDKFFKYIFIDSGLLLRIYDLDLGGSEELRKLILLDDGEELVNKGGITEMVAGWEMLKYSASNIQHDLFYWENLDKGTTAEVDYVTARNLKVLPIEIKSGTSGKMKSLRLFMEKKKITRGIRSSLENFGRLEFKQSIDSPTNSTIDILPLYALSNL